MFSQISTVKWESRECVETCRTLMKKAVLSKTEMYLALFAFRNTPSEGVNVSPTLKLFSRRTTTDFGT